MAAPVAPVRYGFFPLQSRRHVEQETETGVQFVREILAEIILHGQYVYVYGPCPYGPPRVPKTFLKNGVRMFGLFRGRRVYYSEYNLSKSTKTSATVRPFSISGDVREVNVGGGRGARRKLYDFPRGPSVPTSSPSF